MPTIRQKTLMPLALALTVGIGCGESGGCGGGEGGAPPYEYPYGTPGAELTQQVMRARLTESGFDTIAASVPGIVAASCADNPADATANCAIDPNDPNIVRYYLGTQDSPMSSVRVGSYFAIELDTLANIDVTPVPAGQAGYLEITVGCKGTGCGPEDSIRVWVDATYESGSVVCSLLDRAPLDGYPPRPGLILEELTFDLYLHVEPDADGRPMLVFNEEDIVVRTFRPNVWLDIDPVASEGNCDETLSTCSLTCNGFDVAQAVGGGVLAFTDELGAWLAQVIVDQLTSRYSDQPLELAGLLDLTEIIPIGSRYANGTGYVIAANLDTPTVTGDPGRAGLNFDFDAGFVGESSPCVPDLSTPDWTLPAAPDPGQMVIAPNPDTGVPGWEPFDVAVLAGDSFVRRAAFELFDTGNLCFDASARAVEDLTGGAFVPTVALFDLLAPGMASLASTNAPVDLQITPRFPPTLSFEPAVDGDQTAGSQIHVVWPELWVEVYPLVDGAGMRVLTFSTDVTVDLTLAPTPNGNLSVTIDEPPALSNLATIYNEVNLRFDARAVGQLVQDLLLPVLVTGDPIDVALTSELVGLPFVPKIRAINTAGLDRYLSFYLRFCNADEVADPTNALCYEDPALQGKGPPPPELAAWRVGGATAAASDAVRLAVRSTLGDPEALEVSYRVDDSGPWFTFRGPETDGTFVVEHPRLATAGQHTIVLRARHRDRPGIWTEVSELEVMLDRIAPRITAERQGQLLAITAWDDRSPPAQLLVRAELEGPGGSQSLAWGARDTIPLTAEQTATLWAMDEAGMISEPFVVAAVQSRAEPTSDTAGNAGAGCATVPASWIAALAGLLMALGSRRRMTRHTAANR